MLAFSADRAAGGGQDALVTDIDGAGRFEKPVVLAPHGIVGGLAVRADGAETVSLVTSHVGSLAKIRTRLRLYGATSFAPAETVARVKFDGGYGRYIPDAPIPTFDPSTGRPILAWTQAGRGAGRLVVVARERP